MDTKQSLISTCNRIAQEIESGEYDMEECAIEEWEGPCASHYLNDALDIEYTINSNLEYKGARVCVALGGPNIYIDTRHKVIRGYWGTDRVEVPYYDDNLGLDDCCCEMYASLRY